ncbi:MAG: tRNA 4-thiouridine(8) synthase ThiI [Armatimonadetes bacterium]|nr:tRNA 4-thiouridine(8) synthase ThiI [Armatimonadota bacterium]
MTFVIHYHEIALKGKNRKFFVRRLMKNLRRALEEFGPVEVRSLYGRVVVELEENRKEAVRARLATLPGVANFSETVELPLEIGALEREAWQLVSGHPARSFRMTVKRAQKHFPLTSQQVAVRVGAYVMERARESGRELRVDLTRPELTLFVEIVNRVILVHGAKERGPGGLPVGVSGRVVGLLSSGFDSPVAAYQLMRRGAEVVFVHFHSYPYTDRASLDNARQLAEILTGFQFRTRFYSIAFAPVQQEIVTLVPAELRMVVYRRSMFRIASRIAARERAEALVTGESLGQVASQTLTNLAVIDQAVDMPVLRPLIGSNKDDIIRMAEVIGTHGISSQPYQDCCSLMVAPHPVTRARLDEVLEYERGLELGEVENRAILEAQRLELRWSAGQIRQRDTAGSVRAQSLAETAPQEEGAGSTAGA